MRWDKSSLLVLFESTLVSGQIYLWSVCNFVKSTLVYDGNFLERELLYAEK